MTKIIHTLLFESRAVNSWLKRYKSEGISGLSIKPGRGKKPLIDRIEEESAILEAVKQHRQKIATAKAEWEASSGKQVSKSTIKRFLKSLVEDINGEENVVRASPMSKYISLRKPICKSWNAWLKKD